MSELIKRLRGLARQEPIGPLEVGLLGKHAADEIERLRRELAEAKVLLWEARDLLWRVLPRGSFYLDENNKLRCNDNTVYRLDAFLTTSDQPSDVKGKE